MEIWVTCHNGDLTYSSVPEVLKAEFICEFTDRHSVGKILLIGKHQQNGIFQLVLSQLNEQKKIGKTQTLLIIICNAYAPTKKQTFQVLRFNCTQQLVASFLLLQKNDLLG